MQVSIVVLVQTSRVVLWTTQNTCLRSAQTFTPMYVKDQVEVGIEQDTRYGDAEVVTEGRERTVARRRVINQELTTEAWSSKGASLGDWRCRGRLGGSGFIGFVCDRSSGCCTRSRSHCGRVAESARFCTTNRTIDTSSTPCGNACTPTDRWASTGNLSSMLNAIPQ